MKLHERSLQYEASVVKVMISCIKYEILIQMWEKRKTEIRNLKPSLQMVRKNQKNKLRCQADGIYTMDPSSISKKKNSKSKKFSLKPNKKC